MVKVLAGVLVVAAMVAVTALFIYPFVFATVSGLFDSTDLGAILGLAACVIVTIPLIWLTAALIVGVTAVLFIADDKRTTRNRLSSRNITERNRR